MTQPTVLPIVELRALDSRLGRSLSWSAWTLALGSRIAPDTSCYTPVTCVDASPIRDSARGDHRKNPIQTP
jgi:hypothetical protein